PAQTPQKTRHMLQICATQAKFFYRVSKPTNQDQSKKQKCIKLGLLDISFADVHKTYYEWHSYPENHRDSDLRIRLRG
ncbi:hypothetical protein, partial [Mobiluncus mulieris]|uniref:hypothetical protein n=1 Tax=Mobiluncus mulieris TaxID=2052 RepID=UPI00243159E0